MAKCHECGGDCKNIPIAPTVDFIKKKLEERKMNKNKELLKKKMKEIINKPNA